GPKGDTGTTGPAGPSGSNGTTGPKGDPGTKGSTGATAPAGPRGPAGRDAKATCKVTGALTTQHVTCTVKVAGKSAGRALTHASARLMRGGRTYATGTTTRLSARRAVNRGRYLLWLSAGDTTWKIPVRVR